MAISEDLPRNKEVNYLLDTGSLRTLSCRRWTQYWLYKQNVLTNYFEELEDKLQFKSWFCGHYHEDLCIDDRHRILYYAIIATEERNENNV